MFYVRMHAHRRAVSAARDGLAVAVELVAEVATTDGAGRVVAALFETPSAPKHRVKKDRKDASGATTPQQPSR